MKNPWVLVANSSFARIYSGPNSHLEEIETLEHPESRMHGRDLVTDRPGRTFDSVGGGGHGLGSELSPQKNEAEHFAGAIAQHLDHARRIGTFNKLYVIASPSFLGMLRNALHSATRDLVALEVDKDLTSKTPAEIRAYLPFRL